MSIETGLDGIIQNTELLSDVEKQFISGAYDLGKRIAYRGFRHCTMTSYEIYVERYEYYKRFQNIPEERIKSLQKQGEIAYKKGFEDNVHNKTYIEEMTEYRVNHFMKD